MKEQIKKLIEEGKVKELFEMLIHVNNITPEEGKRKSLEDCFSREDSKRYFYKKTNKYGKIELKIDSNLIENGEVFTSETLKNFEQLFMRLGIPKIDKK
jgi:hypothetical protein